MPYHQGYYDVSQFNSTLPQLIKGYEKLIPNARLLNRYIESTVFPLQLTLMSYNLH